MRAAVPQLSHNPYFDAAHRALAIQVRDFCHTHITPLAGAESDEEARTLVSLLAQHGWLRWCVTPLAGGQPHSGKAALDARAMAVVREELSSHSGMADLCFVMQALGSLPISLMGNPAQQSRWLPAVHTGKTISAFALTEPNAGSDVAALSTRAVRVAGGYRLSGHKKFISQAPVAGLFCVFARTADTGAKGLSAFVVEKGQPGLSVIKQEPMAPHPLGEVVLEDVLVPEENRLGAEGDGMRLALRTLDMCRPTVAAAACGMARRALDESVLRAGSRMQGGQLLWQHQLVAQKLARMVVGLSAAQLLTARACHALDTGEEATFHVSQAKLHATETACAVIDDAVQIHGGDGVVRGNVVERLYREIRSLRIYEGTSEIQHLLIARALMRD